jgi:ubiquinone/menaquinone biosynthesis C-methylase UbiE
MMMTTKSPAQNETVSIFASREDAERWHRGKAHRADATGPANELMLDLANLRSGDRVLDVAAGTGDQTLMAARRVGPTGYVLATDISASMLHLAAEAARDAGLTHIETRVMDAGKLDLEPDSFDAVICRMGLMLMPNPVSALIEMRRVVKPSAKVVALVLSVEEKNPYLGIPLAVVRYRAKITSPAPARPGAFALAQPGMLEDIYSQAGFRDAAVQAVGLRRHFRCAADAVDALKEFSPFFLRDLMAKLSAGERDLVWSEIEDQLWQFQTPDGLEVPGEALIGAGAK